MAHKINLFGAIGYWWNGTDHQTIAGELDRLEEGEAVDVHVNSPGGAVFEGLGIYNALKQHSGQVTVYVDALAASAASIIALAGDEVVMGEGSMMMIHNPWLFTIGDSSDHRKNADVLDKIGEAMLGVYVAATGKAEDALQEMLDDETWLTAAEAVEHGFATRVDGDTSDDDVAALAEFGMDAHASVPEMFRAKVMAAVQSREQAPTANQPAPQQEPKMTIEQKKKAQANKGPVAQPEGAAVDVEQIEADARAAGREAERTRQKEIRTAVNAANLKEELGDELIDKGVSADVARKRIFAHLAEHGPEPTPNTVPTGAGVQVGETSAEKFGEGVQNMILARSGIEKFDPKNNFNGRTMLDIARMSLERRGVDTRRMGKMDLVAAAFKMGNAQASVGGHTTDDFTSILSNSAHKAVMRGYEAAEETFGAWTNKGTMTDFKVHSRMNLNHFPSLREVREGAEFKNVTIGDRKETIQLATYGDVFPISRQAMVNDDLELFTKLPMRMGDAAKCTVADLAYAVLTGNPKMENGKALFHADHKNLGNSAFGIDSLAAAITAMRTQKARGNSKKSLGIRMAYAIVPAALELEAAALVASEYEPGTQNKRNKVAGRVEVVGEHRLDDVSTDDWYGAADPSRYDTVELGYLDGNEQPRVERHDEWRNDGANIKVSIDVTAAPRDTKTLRKEDVA